MRTRSTLIMLILLLAAMLLAGCNADGAGIFYTINTEVKQSGGNFPVANQVLEVGNTLYARTGNSLRKLSGSSWSVIQKKDVDSIATEGTALYALTAEAISSDSSNTSYTRSYDGSSWSAHLFDYSDDSTMLTMDGSEGTDQFLVIHANADNTAFDMDRLDASFSGTGDTGVTLPALSDAGDRLPIDAAIDETAGSYYVIGKTLDADNNTVTTLYDSPDFSTWNTNVTGYEGELRSITAEDIGGTDYLFFTSYDPDTSSSRVYYSTGGAATVIDNSDIFKDNDTQVSDAPDALGVVYLNGGTAPYLIVGSADGYYEVDLSGGVPGDWAVKAPTTATADITDSGSFAAKYPDLAVSYVYSVYPDPNDTDVFYLAVGKESGNILGGLWERDSSGSFSKK